MKANPEPPPCWGGLLIYIYPILIVFSMLVQCFITAWRVDHRSRARSRRRHMHHRASSRPRETREEARQRKYRYLYQVRTARGDIISQVAYLCLLYKMQSGWPFSVPLDKFSWLFIFHIWNLYVCFVFIDLFHRIMYRLCKNVYKLAISRHRRIQPKQIHMNETHWTAIAHISQIFPIRMSIKWILVNVDDFGDTITIRRFIQSFWLLYNFHTHFVLFSCFFFIWMNQSIDQFVYEFRAFHFMCVFSIL